LAGIFVVTGTYNTTDVARVAGSDPPALTRNPTGNDVKGNKSDS
jgi:hypothetical protein